MAYLFVTMEQFDDALQAFEQSITLAKIVHYPAAEVAGHVGIAFLFYRHLHRPQDAIKRVEEALAVMEKTGLTHDAAGQTPDTIRAYLDAMRQGSSLSPGANATQTMPQEQIQVIVANTTAVLTAMPERKAAWYQAITTSLHDAQQQGDAWQIEVDFFQSILALLDGQEPTLPSDHPYAPAIREIQAGVMAGGLQEEPDEELPFDPELIPRSVAALSGTPQDKMQHAQYLNTLMSQTTDEVLKALLQTIQVSLFGGNLSSSGENFEGVYQQAWEAIMAGVEKDSIRRQV